MGTLLIARYSSARGHPAALVFPPWSFWYARLNGRWKPTPVVEGGARPWRPRPTDSPSRKAPALNRLGIYPPGQTPSAPLTLCQRVRRLMAAGRACSCCDRNGMAGGAWRSWPGQRQGRSHCRWRQCLRRQPELRLGRSEACPVCGCCTPPTASGAMPAWGGSGSPPGSCSS